MIFISRFNVSKVVNLDLISIMIIQTFHFLSCSGELLRCHDGFLQVGQVASQGERFLFGELLVQFVQFIHRHNLRFPHVYFEK